MRIIPAFIVGAPRSGSGKTTLTMGMVAALVKRGLKVQCFKCGPDFIDPTLHRAITSKDSYNLDLKMMGPDCCRRTFTEKSRGADVVVVDHAGWRRIDAAERDLGQQAGRDRTTLHDRGDLLRAAAD